MIQVIAYFILVVMHTAIDSTIANYYILNLEYGFNFSYTKQFEITPSE